MTTELIEVKTLKPAEVFTEEGIQKLIAQVKASVTDKPLDLTTEKGRKEIASLAYTVARSKTAVDNLGKEAIEEPKKFIDAVNRFRKVWREEMDTLKADVRRPLDEFEAREKIRVDEHKQALDMLDVLVRDHNDTVEGIERNLQILEVRYKREWQEFKEVADQAYSRTKDALRFALSEANKRAEEAKKAAEEQAAKDKELEELRAFKAEQEAKAKKEAEEAAKKDQPAQGAVSEPSDSVKPPAAPEAQPTLETMAGGAPEAKIELTTTTIDGAQTGLVYNEVDITTVAPTPSEAFGGDMSDLIADIYEAVHDVLRDDKLSEEVVDAIEEKLEQWAQKGKAMAA